MALPKWKSRLIFWMPEDLSVRDNVSVAPCALGLQVLPASGSEEVTIAGGNSRMHISFLKRFVVVWSHRNGLHSGCTHCTYVSRKR